MAADANVRPRGVVPGVVIGYPAGPRGFPDAVVGEDAQLESGTVIYRGARIGARVRTGHHVVVHEDTIVGDDVTIGAGTIIEKGVRVGDGVRIDSHCHVASYSILESGASLAPGAVLVNDLYPGDARSGELLQGPWIGPGAHVGAHATVLPFLRVGAGALVGAGAVVTRDVPEGVVVRGVPAVVTGRVDQLVPIEERVRQRTLVLPDDPGPSGRRGVVHEP